MDPLRGDKHTTAALFAAQHGVLHRRQALAAGLTPKMIECRLRGGVWVTVHRGVYRLAGVPVTWRMRLMAACLAGGPRAVASHRAAGALLGLDGMAEGRIEVTAPTSVRRDLRGLTVHQSRTLGPADRGETEGIPHTSAARTIVDLAAVLPPRDLEAALDSALREGRTTVPHLERHVARLGDGRAGIGELRDLLADRAEKRPYESRKEAQLARLLVAAGLPEPVRQHELTAGGRVIARFDLAWPEARIAVEFQSYRHHVGRQAWRRDAGRANAATAHGWRVFSATEEDLRERCVSLAAQVAVARAA